MVSISPTIPTIDINNHTYTHEDFENNLPGTLGAVVNDVASMLAALELVGTLSKAISGDTTLTANESTNLGFVFTGTLSAAADITFAAGFDGPAFVFNNTTGGYDITCGLAAGDTVTIPNGKRLLVFCDGTDFSLLAHRVTDLVTTGNASIGGTLAATGNTTLSGTLGVTGATTLSSTLAVTGVTTLSSTLAVTGATTLSSTLAVTGASTLTGNVSVGGTLGVTGNINASAFIVCDNDIRGTTVTAKETHGGTYMQIDSPDGEIAVTYYKSNDVIRWAVGKAVDSETGSNAGSPFQITRFSDAGANLGVPFQISRDDGTIQMVQLPTSSAGLDPGTLWNNSGVLNIA